eukprot:jgi/Mesvir1/10426/Mv12690-RA.1
MKVKFWGTRGSISKAGKETLRYGGHTSCIEITTNDGVHLVLDCGTGMHGLGAQMAAREGKPINVHLLITQYTNWDHIQGLPFFAPLFIPGNNVHVYGPHGLRGGLQDALRGQMQYMYFPMSRDAYFGATVKYHDLAEETFTIGDIKVTTRYMNHPAETLGYRIEADGATVVYCTGHEPHDRYAAEERPSKAGWGHSTVEYAVDMASYARVRQVALFHHDPMRSDDEVDAMVALGHRRVTQRADQPDQDKASEGQLSPTGLAVVGAMEGYCTYIGDCPQECQAVRGKWLAPEEAAQVTALMAQGGKETESRSPTDARECLPRFSGDKTPRLPLVVFVTDDGVRECVRCAVQADPHIRAHFADSREDLQQLLARKNPAILVLGKSLAGVSQGGLALSKQLREEFPGLVCVIACGDGHKEAGHPDISDWLQWPFSQHYARTRLTALLSRHESKWVAADRCSDEGSRLAALRDLGMWQDAKPDARFDAITNTCTTSFKVPYAFISVVDSSQQWYMSKSGNLPGTCVSREESFCAHTILQEGVFEIVDATADPRFADNPLVTGDLRLRFYAGVPLAMRGGHKLGSLCIADNRPKKLTKDETETLRQLGVFVSSLLELYRRKSVARPLPGSTSAESGPCKCQLIHRCTEIC